MELVSSLTCPCRPGFVYKNEVSLRAHKKTKVHATYVATQENRQDRARSKEFENEVERLKRRLIHKEEIEMELMMRIHQLEGELAWYKNQFQSYG